MGFDRLSPNAFGSVWEVFCSGGERVVLGPVRRLGGFEPAQDGRHDHRRDGPPAADQSENIVELGVRN